MIVVRVELHHATALGKVTELARMEIANDETGTTQLRNYIARTLRGRSTAALNQRVKQRETKLSGWPSDDLHVWNLVSVLLHRMGYGARATLPENAEG